jgi:AraC-like DNA-binding protein/quercetin dioxygenase-like cupin family protein
MPGSTRNSLDRPVPFLGQALDLRQRAEMREVLVRMIEQTERRLHVFKVPAEAGQLQKHPDMHFHFKPELFIQLRGVTEFTTPKETVILKPGEMMVMPAGVPHREYIETDREGRFRNLVIGYYSNTLSLHFAHEVAPHKPDIQAIEFFDAPNLEVFVMMTTHLVSSFHASGPGSATVTRGLLAALLGMFLNVVETGSGHLNRDIGKVFQTKWLVREQLSNPNLNVKSIAEKLQCSPDYLSHLFHTQTREKLVHYIQRMRMEGAMLALETTSLYISEIAWSSGFQDPAYFARVFRKFTGEAPQAYRDRLQEQHRQREADPKTIYYDHVDYSHGVPVAQGS